MKNLRRDFERFCYKHRYKGISNLMLYIAIGTAIVARAAAKLGLCDPGTAARVQWLLQRFGLPLFTAESAADLALAARSDKKRSGGTVNLIIPMAVGRCVIRPTAVDELESFIQAGL